MIKKPTHHTYHQHHMEDFTAKQFDKLTAVIDKGFSNLIYTLNGGGSSVEAEIKEAFSPQANEQTKPTSPPPPPVCYILTDSAQKSAFKDIAIGRVNTVPSTFLRACEGDECKTNCPQPQETQTAVETETLPVTAKVARQTPGVLINF